MSTVSRRRLIHDAPIRAFHLLFATGFAAAWLTGDAEGWRALHVALGYGLAGLLSWRLIYGLAGPRHARLGAMARRAAGLVPWLRALPAQMSAQLSAQLPNGGERRPAYLQQGQTLLLVLLPLMLMAGLPFLVLSGLAGYQDWGGLGELAQELHEALANALGLIALAHPLMVLGLSLWRQRNLAAPMWSGRVAGPGPDLVPKERVFGALLLVACVVAATLALWRQERRNPVNLVEATEHHRAQTGDDDD